MPSNAYKSALLGLYNTLYEMKIINSRIILCILLAAISFVCNSQSNAKTYVSFYKDQGLIQYFIKPLIFVESNTKDQLNIDFTFVPEQSVNINLSVLSGQKIKSIDSITIANSNVILCSTDLQLLFIDKYKKSIESRYTCKTQYNLYPELFADGDWTITIYTRNKKFVTHPKKKGKKINKVNDELFSIL